jgi:hypothetical protein
LDYLNNASNLGIGVVNPNDFSFALTKDKLSNTRKNREYGIAKFCYAIGLYEIESQGLKFTGNVEDWKEVLAIRPEYIHLSAHNATGHKAAKGNKRIIYNG